jgi:hypothetical protein
VKLELKEETVGLTDEDLERELEEANEKLKIPDEAGQPQRELRPYEREALNNIKAPEDTKMPNEGEALGEE